FEADRARDAVDVVLVAEEEGPTVAGTRTSVFVDVELLLQRGALVRVLRVDADREGAVLLAHRPADLLQRLDHVVQDEAAEDGAGVVGEGEEDRALAVDEIADPDHLARGVVEDRVLRELAVELFADADVLELLRDDRIVLARARAPGPREDHAERRERRDEGGDAEGRARGAKAGGGHGVSVVRGPERRSA